jgi:hypothetical protein
MDRAGSPLDWCRWGCQQAGLGGECSFSDSGEGPKRWQGSCEEKQYHDEYYYINEEYIALTVIVSIYVLVKISCLSYRTVLSRL